uniref:Ig-like domain-containing protein n=1 Tax=Ditylenchus dipsaci TaxID=166011 RepID=A0A915CRF4_9BILA
MFLFQNHVDKYTCVAKNIAGEDKHDFFLSLLGTNNFLHKIFQQSICRRPKIDSSNVAVEIQVNVGRSATLMCPATGSPEPTIAWLKDGRSFDYSSTKHRFTNSARQLQILEASGADSGRYTCIATNSVGAADLDIFLTVIDAPELAGPETEPVTVVLNKAGELVCDAKGTEPMTIEWQKGGRTINSGAELSNALVQSTYLKISERGRKLHLLSAQRSDATRWTCLVKNSAGEARKNFDLSVQIPPTVNETASSSPIMSVLPGDQFKLDCVVDGNPPPLITWSMEDEPLKLSDFVVLTNNNQTVWVRRANNTNAGRYHCDAENSVGSASRSYIVRVTGPPILDLSPSGNAVEELNLLVGDHSVLKCQVLSSGGSDPNQLITKWIIDGSPVEKLGEISSSVSLDNSKIVIHNARLSDTGEYTCIVENGAGQARKKFVIHILERPRFLDTTNTHYSVIEGRPLMIDCLVTGTPKPTVTWLKVGYSCYSPDSQLTLKYFAQ